jgi:hypothetical protein
MQPSVSLEDVSITRVSTHGHMGATELDGVVTLLVRSDGINFKYAYKFTSSQTNVLGLVANAAALLKRELEGLIAASQNVFPTPRAPGLYAPALPSDTHL